MRWPFEKRQDPLLKTLEIVQAQLTKQTEMIMKAMETISATQKAQVEAINTHLSLFKMVGDAPPEDSLATLSGKMDDAVQALEGGFPFEKSPTEQALWIQQQMAIEDSEDLIDG